MALKCQRSKLSPVVVIGAVPRGFSVRLVEALEADVTAAATDATDEPTDRKKEKPMSF